jgi:hypothetical protein
VAGFGGFIRQLLRMLFAGYCAEPNFYRSRSGERRIERLAGEDGFEGSEQRVALFVQRCQVAATNNVAKSLAAVLARQSVGRSGRRP